MNRPDRRRDRPPAADILHADLDSFYASVEQRDDPSLRGKPVIVGAGVVLAASYEAKAYGIRTPMNGRDARRLCPHAIVVSPRMHAYAEASRAVFEVFHDTTPIVEGLSIDEAFLDVSGLRAIAGPPDRIAVRLRAEVLRRVGLPITVGVARTKFLAKVASGVAKPDGLLVVPPDRELAFLHALPIERLWGVGEKTSIRLRDRGIESVGDVARLTESTLVTILGKGVGRHLHALANGRDPRPVEVGRRRRSVGAQHALGRRGASPEHVDAILASLAERVTGRMRSAGRTGRTVTLRLRFGDFERVTRSHTLPQATAQTRPVLVTARALLEAAGPEIRRRGLTLVGIAVSGLDDTGYLQLALPYQRDDPTTRAAVDTARDRALDGALDRVRERFGSRSVTRAVLLGRDTGIAVPILPD